MTATTSALMSAVEFAWVRDHVWTRAMRKTYREVPGLFDACACQYGLTSHCQAGDHGRCHRATPLRDNETYIDSRAHEGVALFPEPYEHPTDTSATGPRRERLAQVWLADRVCRWVCPCACHGLAPKPTQIGLW